MYERPTLNRVGDAQDVILGAVPTGNDLDATYIPGGDDGNAWDGDVPEGVVPQA